MDVWQTRTQPNRDKGRQRLVLAGLAAACAAFIVCSAFTLYQDLYEADIIRAIRPNGIVVNGKDGVLIYDHGPFCEGGMEGINPSADGPLEIQKTLIIPQEDRDQLKAIFDETGATDQINLVERCSKAKAEEMGMTLEEYGKYTFEYNSGNDFDE